MESLAKLGVTQPVTKNGRRGKLFQGEGNPEKREGHKESGSNRTDYGPLAKGWSTVSVLWGKTAGLLRGGKRRGNLSHKGAFRR